MEKFVSGLIQCLAHIFAGTRRELYLRTSVIRISGIHPVYINIDTPASRVIKIGLEEANPDFDACEAFKERCKPVAFFPGRLENNFPLRQYPIYLVVPWRAKDIPDYLSVMRGLVLFNRVVGPDRVDGPSFDNEPGQWGAVILKDEVALKNFPYQEHDKTIESALGENWRDIGWLRALLSGNEVLYKVK